MFFFYKDIYFLIFIKKTLANFKIPLLQKKKFYQKTFNRERESVKGKNDREKETEIEFRKK